MLSSSRKIIISLAAIGIALGIMIIPSCIVRAAEDEKLRVDIYDNEGEGEYYYYMAHVMCSYLTEVSDGYQIVCVNPYDAYYWADVKIYTFGSDFSYKRTTTIEAELPIFGGFFNGSDGYYLVWGQSNPNEDNSCEVIRIVKYDKNWNRIDSASLYGADTYIPFDAGSLRMTECGDYLYIRTCHEMYASSDGLHHQSNYSIEVRKSDMSIVSGHVFIGGSFYCSHSFNQFIIVDDNNKVITLDHGDAYPRSAVLVKSTKNAADSGSAYSPGYYSESIMTYYGKTGENFTGATLGGLEYSDSNYLTVGASVDQSSDISWKTAKNVYVSATGREAVGEGKTKINWITDYTEESGKTALDTKLVKINSNKFLVIWSEYDPDSDGKNLKYVFVNGAGNTISDVYSKNGSLSDCQPVLIGNKVMWYVSCSAQLRFYTIDTNGVYNEKKAVFPSNVDVWPKSMADCRAVVSVFGYPIWNEENWFDNSYIVILYGDRVLEEGTNYRRSVGGCTYSGEYIFEENGTYVGGVDFYGYTDFRVAFAPQSMSFTSVEESQSSVLLKWTNSYSVLGYSIERKVNSGSFKQVADVQRDASYDTMDWTDKNISVGNKYTYRIRAYSTDGSQIIYSDYSDEKTVDITATSTATPIPVAKNPGWKQESGNWYYYNSNGSKVTGWQQISRTWYFFDGKGVMKTGWIQDGSKWYYMNGSGAMLTGWVQDDDNWYYMSGSGAMQTGWIQSDGKWYYLDSSGAMTTDWVQDGDNWYYMNGSGAMQTGWIQSDDKWYYLGSSGAMATGWVQDGDNWYYMSSSGAMQTGWIQSDGKWYYLESSGAMATGWVQDSDNWYYMSASGVMQTGWIQDGGKWYYLDSSGAWAGYA